MNFQKQFSKASFFSKRILGNNVTAKYSNLILQIGICLSELEFCFNAE